MILTIIMFLLFILISILIWGLVGWKWNVISDFFHKRYSFIDMSFIIIYFIEQVVLAGLIYLGFNAQLIAGFMSIIIITTASIQNKYWESRSQKISNRSNDQGMIIKELKIAKLKLISDNEDLRKELKKSESFIEYLFKKLEKIKKLKKKR